MTTTALADTSSSDLLTRLNGRLPSGPEEIREAIRLGEENIKVGTTTDLFCELRKTALFIYR